MFELVEKFEKKVSSWFGAKHGVAVDSCTHGIEICLRLNNAEKISVPKRTYISIPFLANKLGLPLEWRDENWQDYYYLGGTPVVDAAVLWEKDGYITNTLMCLSFQFQKHLSLGRGGMILTDDSSAAEELKKMSYDGRRPEITWREQNISSFGYHYYMTPETAKLGLEKLPEAFSKEPRRWAIEDWPDLTKMEVFKK